MGNTLPKRILKMKGLSMQQKWNLHKKGSKRKSSGAAKTASKGTRKKGWGVGRWLHTARIFDTISASAQGAVERFGFKKAAFTNMRARYASKGLAPSAHPYATWKGIGTGLASNYVKSKAGVYRGAGKLKMGSMVQAALPELLALKDADPTKDHKAYNWYRHMYNSGYNIRTDAHHLDLKSPEGKRFWEEKAISVAIGVGQKLLFNTNGWLKLNRFLPKDFNV